MENILKKMMRISGLSFVIALAMVVGGCSVDGGPVITEDIGTVLNDSSELSVRVKRALRNSPRTAILNVNVVKVSDDTVRISGFVNNQELIYEVERVAGRVEGVRHVFNDLNIR